MFVRVHTCVRGRMHVFVCVCVETYKAVYNLHVQCNGAVAACATFCWPDQCTDRQTQTDRQGPAVLIFIITYVYRWLETIFSVVNELC